MGDPEDDGLAGLTLFDSSDSDANGTGENRRAHKLRQTEEQFLAQKAEWRPLDQNLEASSRLNIRPCDAGCLGGLALKTKAEQEYYLRQYENAKATAEVALMKEGDPNLGETEIRELRQLVELCQARLLVS